MPDFNKSSGQTLLELVIAIGVVAVIVTGLMVAATASLRYSQDSRMRSSGVKLAQEGIELSRQLRDSVSWTVFSDYSGSGTKVWCLDSTGTFIPQDGVCPVIGSNSPYTRSVTFTWNDPIMTIVSLVTWQVGSIQASTQLQTYLTQWK